MKKFLFLCTALALVSPSAYAQFELNDEEISGGKGVLSLTDGIVLDKEKKPEEPKAEDNEDKGIFSFMDFSFLKKDKPKLTALPNERKETFVQRITRQAEEGDVDAQLSLGYMYLYGEDGVPVDYKKAFTYYNMAAAQNDPIAVNNLAVCISAASARKRILPKRRSFLTKRPNSAIRKPRLIWPLSI